MKRLFLTVVAVLSMTMTFAENEKLNNVNNANTYNMSVNMGKLSDYLGLSYDQVDVVQQIHSSFCADMMNAAGAANADERKSMIDKAVSTDLKCMHYVLTGEQYRKYLKVLNVTFLNRGLEM